MHRIEKIGRLRTALSRFKHNNDGATAIEFGILAIPFILIVFAVLETSLSFTAQQVMANSVDQAARKVRTGQIDPKTTNKDQFRAMICHDLELLVSSGCPELEFDLKSYKKFSDVPTTIPMETPKKLDTSGFTYEPGGAGTINHLRVFYRWPVITDIMKSHLSGLEDGKTLLYSSSTWQNEPF
ncbi:TadE/TadG family type IV pilus assembly protein [Ahrensia kielensis]|uniref:TadE/TadG family type IV pilus assembly protein n=1 Tax=Ahrensia kielensis TaxID=76980 RepID=UPI000382D9EA|nr:TadE/TadG family type IV pilus assembly protein [Ahrensia kielensis]